MSNIYFPLCAVFINTLIFIVFYSKKRYESSETKAYSVLIKVCLAESILACTLVILMSLYGKPGYIYNLHRIDYVLMLFWVWGIFNYVLIVSVNNEKTVRKVRKFTIALNVIISIIFFFLNVNVINENGIIDTNGQAMDLLFYTLVAYTISIVILVLKSLLRGTNKSSRIKYLPLLFLAMIGVISLAIRSMAPQVLLISFAAAFSDLIMFFTIENPDVKTIYELNKNRKLLDSLSEEKSNFLFSMSQETKKPLDNILEVKRMLEEEKDLESISVGLKVIENNARELKNTINNILDVSNISSSKLLVTTESYNIYTVLNTCLKNVETKVNENVILRTEISKNIPTNLYGDSVKLKQIISSILINAAKYTKSGFIDVTANEIIKYDVCRLIIKVEDTGCGIDIEKLNELLKSNNNLEDTDLLKLDNLDVDLKLAFKIIKKLGGYINIRSEENIGSTVTIVLDQKINENKDSYYSKYLFNKKKVLVVCDNPNTLKAISNLSQNYNFELLTTINGNDCVERVRMNESFDLIILEDEMKMISGYSVLSNLIKAKRNYNIPTIIMLDKSKEKIKEHYIEDGFKGYIIKENLEEDFNKIIKKYI